MAKPRADEQPAGSRWAPENLRYWSGWLVLVLVLVGWKLRLNAYSTIPALSDNADEMAWAWSGLTLITKHMPYGWSYFPSYKTWQDLTFHGQGFRVVHPWFDHPPAFSLVVGGWSWLNGARALTDVTLETIRMPAVFLSTVTIPLTYLLGRRIAGVLPATVAAILLTVAPAEVLFSHVVESEALLAPLFLLTLLLLHQTFTEPASRWRAAGLLFCCALAPLVKIPGIALCLTVGAILVARGRWKLGGAALAGGLTGILVFVLYGALLNWSLFTAVQLHQTSRHLGLSSAFAYIGGAVGISFPLHDGWWLLGWIALGGLLLRNAMDDEAVFLGWPVVFYAVTMMVMADPHLSEGYGWYRITLYPLLYLLAGGLVWRAVSTGSVVGIAVTLAVAGGVALNGLGDDHKALSPSVFVVAATLAAVFIPCLLRQWRRDDVRIKAWAQISCGAAVGAVLAANVVQTLQLPQIFRSL